MSDNVVDTHEPTVFGLDGKESTKHLMLFCGETNSCFLFFLFHLDGEAEDGDERKKPCELCFVGEDGLLLRLSVGVFSFLRENCDRDFVIDGNFNRNLVGVLALVPISLFEYLTKAMRRW